MKATLSLLFAELLICSSLFAASVPNTINYQGRLTDAAGAPVPDGAMLITFTIHNTSAGGTTLWSSGQRSPQSCQIEETEFEQENKNCQTNPIRCKRRCGIQIQGKFSLVRFDALRISH